MGNKRRPSMNPAENDLVSGGPYLNPPTLGDQGLVGNQEVLDRIAGRGGPRPGVMGFDNPNPQLDPRLRLPIADRLPIGGDGLRDKVNEWIPDPYGLRAPQPKPTSPDQRSNTCSDLTNCPDSTGQVIIPSPKKGKF